MSAIGIVDEPVKRGGTDELQINLHSEALIDFVNGTETPITIGIQGEWGSGKTSLINTIYHHFDSNQKVKQIWINSWEYSLLSTPEEALLKIINKIIEEIVDADTDKKTKDTIKAGAEKIFKGALRVGAQVALGNEAGSVAKELLDSSGQNISTLRQQLTDVIEGLASRSTNPYEKILIYVDDLDRINPQDAVAILELLKNIFSVPKCVFILAIDYQVVVKGLEGKFGTMKPENEWEFRAFFDKIIQLPFTMPMGQYNIGNYVNSLLIKVGFIKEAFEDENLRRIIEWTIGGNPRSIKRLINSISLIKIFSSKKKQTEDDQSETKITEDEEKLLLFSLLCLQIAYPRFYDLLQKEPDIKTAWNDNFAFAETMREEEKKEQFAQEFDTAKEGDDFNEDWEQTLYRICYTDSRLKARASYISQFLSFILEEHLKEYQDEAGVIIANILSQTAVTSVSAQAQVVLPEREGRGKRRSLENFETWLVDMQRQKGSDEEEIKIVKDLHETIKKEFPEATHTFHRDWSVFLNKHRFISFAVLGNSFKNKGMGIGGLCRHYENDYRRPEISGLISNDPRTFVRGKHYTARYADGCGLSIPSLKSYKANKDSLMKTIRTSADMMTDENYPKRLKIVYTADKSSCRSFDSNNYKTDDPLEVEDICEKYLAPDYKYQVT